MGDGRDIVYLVPDLKGNLDNYEEALIDLQKAAGALRGSQDGGKEFYTSLAAYLELHDELVVSARQKQLGLFSFF